VCNIYSHSWDKNCYKCISIKNNENVITGTHNREFSWTANQRRHFWLQGSKATKFWAKIGTKSRKNSYNFSCMWHIYPQFGFEIGFVLSAKSVTLPYNGQRGVTMAINLGSKIAINAFLREIMGIWLLTARGFHRPIQRRYFIEDIVLKSPRLQQLPSWIFRKLTRAEKLLRWATIWPQ